MMTEATLAIQTGNGEVQEKDTAGPEEPGHGIESHACSDGSSIHEMDEIHEPEPPPLHKKLLAIAEVGQPANTVTLAEFDSLLLEKTSDINAQDATGKTALHIAIEHGLKAEAHSLLHGGADVTIADCEGQQPLYLACVEGHTELVELLLSKEASLNAASNHNETPIAAACRKGHIDIVNILLKKQANTKISDKESWTPLHWASWENHEEIVKRLLEVDTSNINATETNENWTPLNAVAYRGHKEVVSLLLEKKANLYIKDSADWTPLMTATRMQHPEIVRMILHHTIGWKQDYLEIPDGETHTPLHVASMEGSYEIVSQLVSAGASCDARAEDGRTPLHLACLRGNELIAETLLERQASIDATDSEGMTPLHLASGAVAGDKDVSEPDPILPGPSGHDGTDLEKRNLQAKSGRHLAVVELLLRNGASPGIKATNGDTALHRAAALGDKARIDVLLKIMKAENFSWGNWKDSPVHSALGGGDPRTAMESLLAKQEVKKAPFWKEGGRIQVIKEAVKDGKPQDILDLIFRELPRDGDNPPEGYKDWGPIQWAAHERLPDVLSGLINKSGPVDNVDQMVHEALQITSTSISSNELQSESSCELLVQVMWILITSSERTPKNTDSVRVACDFVRSKTSFTEHEAAMSLRMEAMGRFSNLMEEYLSTMAEIRGITGAVTNRKKKFSLTKESDTLREVQETYHLDLRDMVRNFQGRAMKDMERHTSKNVKSIAILSTLQDILKDPPFAQISQTHRDEVDYSPAVPGPDHRKIVEKAEATVVGFFKGKGESGRIRRNRPIQEIVYDPGPTDVVGTAIRNLIDMTRRGSMRFNSKLYAKENLKLTWVHLPSTNMVWMNDLLTRIMSYEGYRTREYYEVRSFFRDSWVEVPDKESRSRMMRPRSVIRPMEKMADLKSEESAISESSKDIERENRRADREGSGAGEKNEKDTKKGHATAADSEEDEQKVYDDWNSNSRQPVKKPHGFVPASAIYMPYLAYSTHCRHWDDTLDTESRELKQAHKHYEELLEMYKGKDKQQHGSPTLDEWYYQFAQEDDDAKGDQKTRNESQVVSKYLKENPETKNASDIRDPNQWTVVRVNQLWIWTISKDWIITATSSPFTNSSDALVEEILNQLSKQAEYGGSRAQPVSATELVPLIIDHCIGSYEKRPNDAGRISIGQTFSHYINRIGRKETTLFDDFRAWSPDEHQKKKANDKRDSRSPARNSHEIYHERTAETTPATTIPNHVQTRETTQHSHSQDISAAIKKAKDLYCDIKDVRDELNILKSVAQYQQIVQRGLAGKEVDESRFSSTYVVKDLKELDSTAERIQSAINTTLSLQQSEVANRQATEATRQGKTVMTFTFATVLFLPLSFLSSLFALDVASFQEAPAWAFYIIFFVSIGISAILGFSVFYWEKIRHAKHRFVNITSNAFEDLFKPAPNLLAMSKNNCSGDEETRRIMVPVSILPKNEGQELGLMSRIRGHARRNDIDDIENRGVTSMG